MKIKSLLTLHVKLGHSNHAFKTIERELNILNCDQLPPFYMDIQENFCIYGIVEFELHLMKCPIIFVMAKLNFQTSLTSNSHGYLLHLWIE